MTRYFLRRNYFRGGIDENFVYSVFLCWKEVMRSCRSTYFKPALNSASEPHTAASTANDSNNTGSS
ncbi:MAG: hypothetical protein LBQ66_07815, partial [Planctomycetaceae bacterium]|nr:hypothetical protein [Planctomycetaceae bacterium]